MMLSINKIINQLLHSNCRISAMNKYPSHYTQINKEVLKQMKAKFMNYDSTPFCFVEISHRSRFYDNLNVETQNIIKKYFNAEQYQVLLLPSGTAMSSIYANIVEPDTSIFFYSQGSFSYKYYKEMAKYHKETRQINTFNELTQTLLNQNVESKKILHFNKIQDGLEVKDFQLTQEMRKKLIIIKNLNYWMPVFSQNQQHTEQIIYFQTQAGFSIPGFTVILLKKQFFKNLVAKQNCPDMFDFIQMHKMKSVVNTPATLCTFVLYENIKYAYQNKESLIKNIMESKRFVKTALYQQGFIFTQRKCTNQFVEASNFVRFIPNQAAKVQIEKLSQIGWYNAESNIISIFIQPGNQWSKIKAIQLEEMSTLATL